MALPTLSSYTPYRPRSLGIQLAWKREQQCRRQEQSAINAKYFRDQNVLNHFHAEWTSRHSFENSMGAYCKQRLENDKTNNLEQRRMRLRRMLQEEQKQLDTELELVGPHDEVTVKTDARHSLRNERSKKLAQELLKEHRKRRNPELQQKEMEAREMCRLQSERERTQREDAEKIKQADENGKLEESERAQLLQQKMEELGLLEKEATHLKKEEETLQVKLWELDKMEVERRKFEERRKKAKMRHFLIRQYRAQLRRRAQQVQEELESDHKILAALLKGEQEKVTIEGLRRERVFADAAWMSRAIEEQLELERERQAELDCLHREGAQRVWEKREATWERERKARELLMHEVLAGRRQQLELKMRKNREAQLESLRRREELIQELELAKELRRQAREELRRRKEPVQEIGAQEEQQLQEQWEEQCKIEELQEERDAHLTQEEALKQRGINNANQPEVSSKARLVWT